MKRDWSEKRQASLAHREQEQYEAFLEKMKNMPLEELQTYREACIGEAIRGPRCAAYQQTMSVHALNPKSPKNTQDH